MAGIPALVALLSGSAAEFAPSKPCLDSYVMCSDPSINELCRDPLWSTRCCLACRNVTADQRPVGVPGSRGNRVGRSCSRPATEHADPPGKLSRNVLEQINRVGALLDIQMADSSRRDGPVVHLITCQSERPGFAAVTLSCGDIMEWALTCGASAIVAYESSACVSCLDDHDSNRGEAHEILTFQVDLSEAEAHTMISHLSVISYALWRLGGILLDTVMGYGPNSRSVVLASERCAPVLWEGLLALRENPPIEFMQEYVWGMPFSAHLDPHLSRPVHQLFAALNEAVVADPACQVAFEDPGRTLHHYEHVSCESDCDLPAKHSYWVASFRPTSCFVSNVLSTLGRWDAAKLRWLSAVARANPPADSLFVDIGAHIGTISALASRLGYEVFAVEASAETFGQLKKTFCANAVRMFDASHSQAELTLNRTFPEGGPGTAIVRRVALSNTSGGLANLYRPSRNAGHSHIQLSGGDPFEFMSGGSTLSDLVETATLDEQLLPLLESRRRAGRSTRIGVLKLDVEGHEPMVLLGAQRLLAAFPPAVIVIEVCPAILRSGGWSVEPMFEQLVQLGFSPCAVENGNTSTTTSSAQTSGGRATNRKAVAVSALIHNMPDTKCLDLEWEHNDAPLRCIRLPY
jgi:FkbM family methyltransferase